MPEESVNISDFRQDMAAYLNKVKKGCMIILTSRGRKIAKIHPIESRNKRALKKLERIRKKAFVGDVLSPTGEEWKLV